MGHYNINEWSVLENVFDPRMGEASESIFSIGNGHMGQRANFEERYSGPSLQGSYVAGLYYPDKTRVGWWKNGYPEYFAKVLNAPNWIGIDVQIGKTELDLHTCSVTAFQRELNMHGGVLQRRFEATLAGNNRVRVEAERFVSMASPEIGVVRYAVTAQNDMVLTLTPCLDGAVRNRDANYDETFWTVLETWADGQHCDLLARTNKLDFTLALAAEHVCLLDHVPVSHATPQSSDGRCGSEYVLSLKAGQCAEIIKFVCVASSLDYEASQLSDHARACAAEAKRIGYTSLLRDHSAKWADIWRKSDIVIEGDPAAQQAIRFNIFHLNQTYTGEDERLNVGPKGFTGEKYGGTTYWDTEAYCIPFFLATAPSAVTRNLLLYRYRHLGKAIENAIKLGFSGGAALYPWVTMNGEECHNEWEITFEELHRNGAIAFAIYNYIRHTEDLDYLCQYGLEVLIGIARFWSQRITFSPEKQKYVMLGVTGPNEYENNINNNWYTSTLACWCMSYAAECATLVRNRDPERYRLLAEKTHFDAPSETAHWAEIRDNMFFAYDTSRQIFLQQEGYLDKEPLTVADLNPADRPLNQHWSWDRILRSPFIKQADTLQGIYLFEERFDTDFIRRHFDFYEARTVHESSLSPCIHAILAARIGNMAKAYELYLRTARLDLDDYNCEVKEGLHITSMAGTWMAVVEGFGGKRVYDGMLHLCPQIPPGWTRYTFRILFKDQPLLVDVRKGGAEITYEGPVPLAVVVYGKDYTLIPGQVLSVSDQAGA